MNTLNNTQLIPVAQFLILAGLVVLMCVLAHLYFIYNPLYLSFSETKTITSYNITHKTALPLLSESIVLLILVVVSGRKLYILEKDDDTFYLLSKKSELLLRNTKNIHRKEIKDKIYKEV